MNESQRIKDEYTRREQGIYYQTIYTYMSAFAIDNNARRDRLLGHAFRRHNMLPLADKEILEVGCGKGEYLTHLILHGATPTRLHGNDLIPERIDHAKTLHPDIDFQAGSAEHLPYADGYFDIIYHVGMMSSVLDATMQRNIAQELTRVLKPGGILIWYDLLHANKELATFNKQDVAQLFPDLRMTFHRRASVRFGLRRRLAHIPDLVLLIERIPLLCDWFFAVLQHER